MIETLVKEYNIDGTIDIVVELYYNLSDAKKHMNKAKEEFMENWDKNKDMKVDYGCHKDGVYIYAPNDDYSLDMKIERLEVK